MRITYTSTEYDPPRGRVDPTKVPINIDNLITGIRTGIIHAITTNSGLPNNRATFVEELVHFLPWAVEDSTGETSSYFGPSDKDHWVLDRTAMNNVPVIVTSGINAPTYSGEFAHYIWRNDDVRVAVDLVIDDIFTEDEIHELVRGVMFNPLNFKAHSYKYADTSTLDEVNNLLSDGRDQDGYSSLYLSMADLAVDIYDNCLLDMRHKKNVKFIARVAEDIINGADLNDPISRVMAIVLSFVGFTVIPSTKNSDRYKILSAGVKDCSSLSMNKMLNLYYRWMDPVLTMRTQIASNNGIDHHETLSLRLAVRPKTILNDQPWKRDSDMEILQTMATSRFSNIFDDISYELTRKATDIIKDVGASPKFSREGETPMSLGETKKTRKTSTKKKTAKSAPKVEKSSETEETDTNVETEQT